MTENKRLYFRQFTPGNTEQFAQAIQYWGETEQRLQTGGHYDVVKGECPLFFRRDLSFPLYRYSQRPHVDEFFNFGRLRLNPLLAYRKIENFNEAVGDASEGRIIFGSRRFDKPLRFLTTIRNQWTISFIERRDDERMMKEFGADSCYSVNSLDFFQIINENITPLCDSCLLDRVVYIPDHQGGVNLDDLEAGSPTFAGLFKRAKYSYQREVRPLWEPKGYKPPIYSDDADHEKEMQADIEREIARVSYHYLTVPDAASHCSLIF